MPHGAGIDAAVDVLSPPTRCWYQTRGDEVVVGGSHRSLGSACLMLCIAIFWNSIVSIFVVLALSSTLNHLGYTLPETWGLKINNPQDMGVGMTAFLWLFLTPFIGIGTMLVGLFLSILAGRTEIRLRPGELALFVGVGRLGYRKRLDPKTVRDVRIDYSRRKSGDGEQKQQVTLELDDGSEISVGSLLPPERRKFVGSALSRALKL